jgi:hypothetical protein
MARRPRRAAGGEEFIRGLVRDYMPDLDSSLKHLEESGARASSSRVDGCNPIWLLGSGNRLVREMLFWEPTRFLVRLNHVASFIVNANHSIM